MKKPKLSLVDRPPPTSPAPPATLDKAGRSLWSSILSEYTIEDSGGLAMLEQICAAIDRIAECAAAIDRDGVTISTMSGVVREHPALKVELGLRSFVVRSLHRLGLDIQTPRDISGRPPGPSGVPFFRR